jgi:ABC-2 type transport system permease protein
VILAIARREWAAAFQTPLGWLLLAAGQLILAWVFLRVLDGFTGLEPPARSAGLNLDLSHNLFGTAAVLLLLAAPLLATRALSSERREGTDQLLGAAPVSLAALVLGKLLGLAPPLLLLGLLPLGLVLTLPGAAPVDPGLFLAATVGLWLCALLFGAVGLYAASITSQPALATVIAYGILLLLSVLNQADQLAAAQLSALDWLSWNQHLFWFLAGVVRVSDLAYFGLATALFLALAHRRLANQRLP